MFSRNRLILEKIEITVESGTHVESVKIELNIFAV